MRRIHNLLGALMAAILLITAAPVPAAAQEAYDQAAEYHGTGYRQLQLVEAGELADAPVCYARYGASASEYWDKFGSDYFYEQMSAGEQAFYDGLYVSCMNVLTGTADMEYITVGGENYYHIPYVSAGSLDKDTACDVATIFQISNPQFYFISDAMCWGYDSDGLQFGLCVYEDFADGAVRSIYTDQFRGVVDSMLSEMDQQTDPVEKERVAHDLVIDRTTYAYGSYNQSSAGVFLSGTAVCAGYAEAFALLCNGAGLETICVTSTTHEWNKIRLYGRWYGVDCTWDDDSYGGIYYDYFNVTDAYMEAENTDHEPEGLWYFYDVPDCVNASVITRGNYIYQGVDYSAVFDEYYYLDRYSDLRAAYGSDGEAAFAHFLNYGMKEGRQASASFDVFAYRARWRDLRQAYGMDLKPYYLHYINYGERERRTATGSHAITNGVTVYNGVDYSAVYDYSYYIAHQPDVYQAYNGDEIKVLQHFVTYGMQEGRQASADFDVYAYRAGYQDLRLAYGQDLKSYYLHYMYYGKQEKRTATGSHTITNGRTVYNGVDYSAVYDFNYYINAYGDLRAAFGTDDTAALEHFITYGMQEGRQASDSFNVGVYRNRYGDLRQAYGTDLAQYYRHYITYGIGEGRSAR